MTDTEQEPFQGTAELHGLDGTELHCFSVDAPKGVVNNNPRSATSLRNNPKWGKAQIWHVLDQPVREEGPKAAFGKEEHLLTKEFNVFIAGFMGAPVEAFLAKLGTPRRCLHEHRGAMAAKEFEEADCRMAGVGKCRA
jgi:hypothetical protein